MYGSHTAKSGRRKIHRRTRRVNLYGSIQSGQHTYYAPEHGSVSEILYNLVVVIKAFHSGLQF